VAGCTLWAAAAWAQVSAGLTLLRQGTIVDPATDAVRPQIDILIEGDRIRAVGPALTAPPGARIIDAAGKWVIPGLWDMHVHLWHPENHLSAYLDWGVTGVRDMGSPWEPTLKLWRQVEAGQMAGPHLLSSGPPFDGEESTDAKLPVRVVKTPDEARQALERLYETETDFINVLSNLPLEPYLAIAEKARQWRMPFVGHLPYAIKLKDAIEMRQSSIEHFFGMERMTEEQLREAFTLAAKAGTRFCPTLTLYQRRNPRSVAKAQSIVTLLHDMHVPILAGTDTGDLDTSPGKTLHEELRLLEGAGLSRLAVLRTATSEPARFLQWQTGEIRPGQVADLVVLNADPLTDLGNLANIHLVFIRGQARPPGNALRQPPVFR
jgi:imidazolonepropionase-like amidohydrolase